MTASIMATILRLIWLFYYFGVPCGKVFNRRLLISLFRRPVTPEFHGESIEIYLKNSRFGQRTINRESFIRDYADPEQLYYVYRLSWLLDSHTHFDGIADKKLAGVLKLLCEGLNGPKGFHITAYDASEWVTNLALCASRSDISERVHGRLTEFIRFSEEFIINNLEIYRPNVSNNHVINNIKGLLVCAILVGDSKRAGSLITFFLRATDSTSRLSALLKDRSMHYRLLFLKWYVDINIIWARYFGAPNDSLLEAIRRSISEFGGLYPYFLKYSRLPSIGDNSPDISWSDLHKNLSQSCTEGYQEIEGRDCYEFRDIVGLCWYVCNPRYSVTVADTDYNFLPINNHNHNDLGHISIQYKGRLIVHDPGRLNYLNSDFKSRRMQTSSAHNLPIAYCCDNLMDVCYIKFSVRRSSVVCAKGTLSIHYGYRCSRTQRELNLIRTIEVSDSSVIVDDRLLDPGTDVKFDWTFVFDDNATLIPKSRRNILAEGEGWTATFNMPSYAESSKVVIKRDLLSSDYGTGRVGKYLEIRSMRTKDVGSLLRLALNFK